METGIRARIGTSRRRIIAHCHGGSIGIMARQEVGRQRCGAGEWGRDMGEAQSIFLSSSSHAIDSIAT